MIQRHAHVDGEAKQVWKILVVLSEGMEDGPSLVAVVRLKFSAWTSEVGDAAMSVAGCANPLFKDLVVSCLSPSLTKRAASSCTTDKKSPFPQVMRL